MAMSDESLERCKTVDAILKGPVGDPAVRHPDGTEAGVLGGILRNGLDLYANVRPLRLLPGVEAAIKVEPGQVDYVIVRENTEGLYLSRGLGVRPEEPRCPRRARGTGIGGLASMRLHGKRRIGWAAGPRHSASPRAVHGRHPWLSSNRSGWIGTPKRNARVSSVLSVPQ